MKHARKTIGMGIMALTDVAVGIFVVHIIGKAFGYEVPIYFYPIGMFLALLPDTDYAYWLWQKWRGKIKTAKTHKTFPHYPIIMIVPICSVLGGLSVFWPILGYWAVVVLLCLLSHYVHDTIEVETGMKWLFPFNKKYYRICSFSENELGDKLLTSDTEWFERYYLRLTPRSALGVILFIAAILLVLFW